ncbi:ankyrin repeat domain-containing protein 55-like [Patella vulgata]|uniref:ankyrin repeat domain-containing protein 55-like n=1 Tax=Patella vulgata TaxID=6465 RepID=UPI0024A7F970|nr:ankyrin repeat domain-containing protein 55-like [Patella vulgata]
MLFILFILGGIENEEVDLPSVHQAAAQGAIPALIEAIWQDPSMLELQNEEGSLSPLGTATQAQQLIAIKQLVKMGANINAQDKFGRTSLSIAAYQGWHEGVVYLLRHGAKHQIVDKSGRTPLHASTYDKSTSTMTVLLQTLTQEEVNKPDTELMTALHWAAFHNRPQHMELLVQKGADIFAQDIDGKTPLHWASQVPLYYM